MKVRYKEEKATRDIVLDFTESRFSHDEMLKQVVQRVNDNQKICSLSFENFRLHEKGLYALHHVILNHKSLRVLSFINTHIYSYLISTKDKTFFPLDLDRAVEHFCAILLMSKLNEIDINGLDFHDVTKRDYDHIEEPPLMKDSLNEEKKLFYVNQILHALDHNPSIISVGLTILNIDLQERLADIEKDIKIRNAAEKLNNVFQGTQAAAGVNLISQVFHPKKSS